MNRIKQIKIQSIGFDRNRGIKVDTFHLQATFRRIPFLITTIICWEQRTGVLRNKVKLIGFFIDRDPNAQIPNYRQSLFPIQFGSFVISEDKHNWELLLIDVLKSLIWREEESQSQSKTDWEQPDHKPTETTT